MELRPTQVANVRAFGTSETGTAERFAYEWGNQLAWCQPMKEWILWGVRRGGVWTCDVMLDHMAMMRDTCARQYDESNMLMDDDGLVDLDEDGLPRRAGDPNGVFLRRAHITNALELAKSLVAIHPDSFDRDAWELNTPDGVVDLRSGTLWPHRSGDEDTFLQQTKVTPLSKWSEADTPLWNKHLGDMCHGDKAVEGYLQRLVGMSLVGEQLEKPQLAVQLNGLGRNGKSIFLQSLVDALGSYGIFASNRLLAAGDEAHTTDQTDLEGKRIVVVEEIKRINPSIFNDMTGGGDKTARKVGKDNKTFRKTWTLWFNNNGAMNFTGSGAQSEGTKERLTTVDFGRGIPRADRIDDWAVRLRIEWSGILAWAVAGCVEWQQGGGGFAGLRIPASVLATTMERQEDADPLRMFLNEKYEKGSETSEVAGSTFVTAFTAWCKDSGNVSPGGHKFVYQDLRSHHGLDVRTDSRGRTRIYGIVARQMDWSEMTQLAADFN